MCTFTRFMPSSSSNAPAQLTKASTVSANVESKGTSADEVFIYLLSFIASACLIPAPSWSVKRCTRRWPASQEYSPDVLKTSTAAWQWPPRGLIGNTHTSRTFGRPHWWIFRLSSCLLDYHMLKRDGHHTKDRIKACLGMHFKNLT